MDGQILPLAPATWWPVDWPPTCTMQPKEWASRRKWRTSSWRRSAPSWCLAPIRPSTTPDSLAVELCKTTADSSHCELIYRCQPHDCVYFKRKKAFYDSCCLLNYFLIYFKRWENWSWFVFLFTAHAFNLFINVAKHWIKNLFEPFQLLIIEALTLVNKYVKFRSMIWKVYKCQHIV